MIFSRLRNLWRLSAYEPNENRIEPLPEGTKITQIIKKPQKAVFIPRIQRDPVKDLVNEIPQ